MFVIFSSFILDDYFDQNFGFVVKLHYINLINLLIKLVVLIGVILVEYANLYD